MIKVVVSACLLGSPVRFDGRDKKSNHPVLQRWLDEGRVVSVCPEMLGNLGTPRPPAEIVPGTTRVITNEGVDVTAAFHSGARAALDAASANAVRVAVLKEGSPACGSTYVYDATFTSTRLPGEGITTALLRSRGIAVFSENQLDEAAEYVAALDAQ